MATEKRSIEISYKADLKDLLSKLKTLPNVTAKEAKQMVGELNKQLKRAESEAKKTGQAMKKAGQQGAAGFKSAENALRDFKEASAEAEDKLEGVADQSGEVDRGFAAIGLALNQVNPALGEAAMKGADVAAVSEGLLLTFRNLNPVVLAASAAVAALTLGYASYAEGVKKAGEQTIALREAEKSLRAVQKGIRDNLQGALDDLNDLRDEQLVYTGELTKEELERKKATDATRASFDSRIASQKDVIEGLKEDLRIVDMIQKGNTFLSDSEKDRLITLHNQIVGSEKALNLEDKKGKLIVQMKPLQDAISSEIERQGEALDLIVGFQEEAVEIAGTLQEIKEDEARIAQDLADKAQAKAEADLKAAQELARQLELQNALKEASDLFLNATLEGNERILNQIQERYATQRLRAAELFEITQDQETFEATVHGLQVQRLEEIATLEDKIQQQRIENTKEYARFFISSIKDITDNSLKSINMETEAQEKAAQALFRLNQAASIANIAMQTAENVNKYASIPLIGPLLAGAAIAAGATSAGVVLSQQPPTMHMGGLAPDERTTTILTGEAVLDRTTTRSLGPEGVRRLQNGGTAGEIIIMQPFKHFDRYNKSARKRTGRPLGSAGY
jgi:hypothetical protein